MALPRHFISCDWGTTNFRLRWVETATLRVLGEFRSERGVRAHDAAFRQQTQEERLPFFAAYLRRAIAQLPAAGHTVPVVVSGMASANIGLQELPYAPLPLALTGAGLRCARLCPPGGPDLLLVSGACSADGMMRGEETQAIGLGPQLAAHGPGWLLLPGTHSKHLAYRDGHFTSLRSFLTGELFEVLTRHSILAHSVRPAAWQPARAEAFRRGLERGRAGQLGASLFAIRANHVLQATDPVDNAFYLSGLLIGDELAALPTGQPVFLAAAEPLFTLYRTALDIILPAGRLVCFDDRALEWAFLAGQRKILELHGES